MIKKVSISLLILLIILSFGLIFKKKNPLNNSKKITFWSIQLKPVYEKQIYNIINEFEKEHKGYKIVWIDIPLQEAQKRTLASVLSSTPPDLINLNPDFSILLAQRNVLEFFKEEDTLDYDKNLIEKLKYKDKIYALPFYFTSPVTIYNKEITDKCLKNKIKTYDDIYKNSSKIKECSGVSPFVSSINENDTFYKILNKYGVSNLKTNFEKSQALKVYSMFNEMYKKSYLPKDILTINHREVVEKYMSNQAAYVVIGSNFVNMIKQNANDIYEKSQIEEQLTTSNGKYDIALMNLIIPKKAKNKELALEFIKLLTNKENQLELSKTTNVLPANKYALEDDYFKNCSDDLYDKSRCISASQLKNLITLKTPLENKKVINELFNKTLEEILLDENSSNETIKAKIEILAKELEKLEE